MTACDGRQFAAYRANVEMPAGPWAVVLPDVRGLFRFYEDLAIRFAVVGVDPVAIERFGPTAGVSKRGADLDFGPHAQATTTEGIAADTAAAVALLNADDSDRAGYTVRFCFSGSNSWLPTFSRHGLAYAIGFDGCPMGLHGPTPASRVADIRGPILGLFVDANPPLPAEDIAE